MPDQPRKPLAALHSDVPEDVREFVRCRRDSVDIAPQTLDLPGLPPFTLSFEDGGNGSITIRLDAPGDFMDTSISVSIQDGRLVADTSNLSFGREFVDKWIKDFNADLEANGKRLSGASIRDGKLHLTKERVAAGSNSTTPVPIVEPPMTATPPAAPEIESVIPELSDSLPPEIESVIPELSDSLPPEIESVIPELSDSLPPEIESVIPEPIESPPPTPEDGETAYDWTEAGLDAWFEEVYGGSAALDELLPTVARDGEVKSSTDPSLAPIVTALLAQSPSSAYDYMGVAFSGAAMETDWHRLSVEFKTNFRTFIESQQQQSSLGSPRWLFIGAGVGVVGLVFGGFFLFQRDSDVSIIDKGPPPAAAPSAQSDDDPSAEQADEPVEAESGADEVSYIADFGPTSLTVQLGADAQTGEGLPYTMCATDAGTGEAVSDVAVYITLGNEPGGWLADHDNGVTDATGCVSGELRVREEAGPTQLFVSDGGSVAPIAELVILPGDKPGIDMTDAFGDQHGDDSLQVGSGGGNPGGDMVMLFYTQEPNGSHTFGIQLAGDGMQYTRPGNAWYDVIISTQDADGGMWQANGAWFSGEYQDRGIRLGAVESGRVPLENGVVTMEFLAPDMFEMNVDGGGEPLDLTLFLATIGVSADGETFWDSALGVAGPP